MMGGRALSQAGRDSPQQLGFRVLLFLILARGRPLARTQQS